METHGFLYISGMLRFALITFLCFWLTTGIAQLSNKQNAQIDSLKQVIESAIHDSSIVNAYLEWDNIIYISDPELDLQLNKKIIEICNENLVNKLSVKSNGFFQNIMAGSYNNIGIIYMDQGNYEQALEYYDKNLKICQEIGDKSGMASSYNNIGIIFDLQGNYEQALAYYDKSLKINQKIGDKKGMADALGNIGIIYMDQGNYEQALEHYYKSLKIKEEISYKRGMAISYNNIGFIYAKQGNYEKALAYYNKSLKINQKIGDKKRMADSYVNIGFIYKYQGNYTKALDLGKKSLALAQEVGAVEEIKLASELLYDVCKKTGQPDQALEMYEIYIEMHDSIINEENTRALIQQEYKYKYEKEQAVVDAKHQEETNLSAEREKRQQLISYGTGAGLVLVLVFAFMIFNRFKLTKKQKEVIEQKNKHITESISYARRIQEASLTSTEYLDKVLDDYFIFYQPRDIVSGDFYWVYKIDEDKVMVAICDCTGHGVPGAFMSMISTSLLNEIVIENSIIQVDQVLINMRNRIIKALKQDKEKAEALDGLDMTLILIDKSRQTLHFASAGHTLYIARNGSVLENKGDPYPVGFFFGREKPFSSKEIALQKGDVVYMTSDGFIEQFGGKDNKMFGYEKFKKLIAGCKDQPMEEQRKQFYQTFNNWKGGSRQIDDICVMGVRI